MLENLTSGSLRRLTGDQLPGKLLKVTSPHTGRRELGYRLAIARSFFELGVEVDDRLTHHILEPLPQLCQDLSGQLGPHVVLVGENPDRGIGTVPLPLLLDHRQLLSQPVEREVSGVDRNDYVVCRAQTVLHQQPQVRRAVHDAIVVAAHVQLEQPPQQGVGALVCRQARLQRRQIRS